MNGTDDTMSPLDVVVHTRLGDVAHGFAELQRRARTLGYYLRLGFALLFGLFIVGLPVLVGRDSERTFDLVSFVCSALTGLGFARLFYLLPTWVNALLLRVVAPAAYTPYRLVSLGASSAIVTSEIGTARHEFGACAHRFETKRGFVFSTTDDGPMMIIPRRAFRDADTLERFRTAFFASSPVVHAALHAFTAEPLGEHVLRYRLTESEFVRGHRRLTERAARRLVRRAIFVVFAAYFFYLAVMLSRESPTHLGIVVLIVSLSIAYGRYVARRRLRAALVDVELVHDDRGVRVRTSQGGMDVAWSDVVEMIDDPEVLVLRLRREVGLIVPKRILAEETLAAFRARCTSAR